MPVANPPGLTPAQLTAARQYNARMVGGWQPKPPLRADAAGLAELAYSTQALFDLTLDGMIGPQTVAQIRRCILAARRGETGTLESALGHTWEGSVWLPGEGPPHPNNSGGGGGSSGGASGGGGGGGGGGGSGSGGVIIPPDGVPIDVIPTPPPAAKKSGGGFLKAAAVVALVGGVAYVLSDG